MPPRPVSVGVVPVMVPPTQATSGVLRAVKMSQPLWVRPPERGAPNVSVKLLGPSTGKTNAAITGGVLCSVVVVVVGGSVVVVVGGSVVVVVDVDVVVVVEGEVVAAALAASEVEAEPIEIVAPDIAVDVDQVNEDAPPETEGSPVPSEASKPRGFGAW